MAAQACDICDICDKAITSEGSSISERGLPNIIKISAVLKDGLDKKIAHKICPIPVHLLCKKKIHNAFEHTKKKTRIISVPGGY